MTKFIKYCVGLMLWCFAAPIITWIDYVNGEYINVALDLFIAAVAFDFLLRGIRRSN